MRIVVACTVGKLGDFVNLTEDPTAVDPETLDQIKVAETIKEGQSISKASPEKLQKKADAGRGMGNPFSDFLVKLVAEREMMNLPPERQTSLMRELIAAAPHNKGCVSNVVSDLTRAMLGQGCTRSSRARRTAPPRPWRGGHRDR